MNPVQLSIIRQLLFFSIDEAARWLATNAQHPEGVSRASWMAWESGSDTLPAYIEERLSELLDFRLDAIEAASQPLDDTEDEDEEAPLVALWYEHIEDFTSLPGHDALFWRPQCSVVAELVATFGADVTRFDRTAYRKWLKGKTDSQETRARWALEAASAEPV